MSCKRAFGIVVLIAMLEATRLGQEMVMQDEPVLTVSAIVGALGAIFGLLAAFGVGVSPSQQDAILNAIPVLFPVVVIIGGVIARSRVSPTAKANQRIRQAALMEPGAGPAPTL